MKSLGIFAAKALALWLVLMAGMMIGGMLFFRGAAAIAPDGPLNATQAMIVVNGVEAFLLAWLAGRMRLRGWPLGLTLAGALFGIETFQSLVEAVVFNNDLHLPMASVFNGAFSGLFRDTLAGVAIAIMWRGDTLEPALPLRGFVWKFPLLAVFYVVCYFMAGAFIAWQSPAVRAFYAHVSQISIATLLEVQLVRGLIWAGLALLLVRSLRGGAWSRAALTGLSISVFMDLQLLYPNPVMPWPVRVMHLIEVGVSNFVFGFVAALILLMGSTARKS